MKIISNNILINWLEWHLIEAPIMIVKAWKNFFVFTMHYFSVVVSIKTFFSYWHKYRWHYGRGFNLARYIEVFSSNLVSRIIGAFLRSFFIISGLIAGVFVLIVGFLVLISWLVLPLITIIILLIGLFYV